MPYELMEEESPSFGEQALDVGKGALRNVGRQISNVATLGIGLPGDIFSMVNDFIARPLVESVTGQKGVPYEETYLGKAIPTTETHRKNLEGTFGENVRPQNKIEKFTDDIIEDFASLFNPISAAKKGITLSKVWKNLAKSVGANLAGETAKQASDSEGAGLATKSGALFLTSLLDTPSAAKQVSGLYKEAEKFLPSTATQKAGKISKQMDSLEHSITKGRPHQNLSAPEKFVVDQVNKVKGLIQNGEMSIEQAIAQKRSLHQELSSLWKDVPGKKEQKTVKNFAKKISSYLNGFVEDYGKTNPKFYVPYKQADQAFGTLAKSNFISNWVKSNIVQHPVTTGLMHLFSPVASGAAVLTAPYQAAKLTYRIAKSPVLAKIYGNALKSAAKEDTVSFSRYLKQLDDSLQEEESKDKYEFLD